MATRVAINGFGRIGRNILRAAKKANADFDFVAVVKDRAIRFDLFAVDKTAVCRVFVENPNIIAFAVNSCVKAR